jgi:protoporphyrinogen oxidase
MAKKAQNILILGAGPAGMACAMELTKNKVKSTIVEKEPRVGGLATTLVFNEEGTIFRTDIGPHRFFSKNPYLYEFIGDLLKEKWIEVPRQTRQFIDGKFYDYPIKPLQAFRNVGVFRAIQMVASYIPAFFKYKVIKKPIKNFEDYIVANFGKKLGEFNMLNYTEKIWGVPCKELHPDWATQRISGLNLASVLKNMIGGKSKDGPKTLIDSFYYPQYGTGLIYQTIAEKIKANGSKIELESLPVKITHKDNKITGVFIKKGKKTVKQKPDWLVSSIPITEFLRLLDPAPPAEVMKAVGKLRWRAQVYLFLTLNKTSITKDNWVYFPNKEIPFGRIAEMKNFSADMAPKDKTSLFVEFFVHEGDKIWNMDKDELFNFAMPYFDDLGFFKLNEVRNYYLLKRRHVYPIYDLTYKDNLKVIQKYMDSFKNMQYIGRPGRFRYNNQDHSLEMGIAAARGIVDGKRYNMDEIGSEKEYLEKGHIKYGTSKKRG